MTSVIDLWRAVDPGARLVSGAPEGLRAAVRSVARTRALPPHLPEPTDGLLLVMDRGLLPGPRLDDLVAVLGEAGLRPGAVVLAGRPAGAEDVEAAGDAMPVIVSAHPFASFADLAVGYLEQPEAALQRFAAELRLSAAEAALAEPAVGTPAGLVAARLRRGAAVSVDGELRSLHPRVAGRALAARFAALHGRLLATSPGRASARRSREGIYLLERRVRQGASVWLFDDLPFARIDEVAGEALAVTLRALLAGPAIEHRPARRAEAGPPRSTAGPPPAAAHLAETPGSVLRVTMVAVARANGRVAPAARALGVHRNTVLHRLRKAAGELGLDPRRPEDALRILREAEAEETWPPRP